MSGSNPTHPVIARGREALARGDLGTAEAAAEERLQSAATDVNALELRSIIQRQRGQIGEAARTLQTVIGIDSRADWAYDDLTQLLLTHGRRADAEHVARAALRANPHNAQAHNLFGLLLSELNDLPSGEWHFRRALELAGLLPSELNDLPSGEWHFRRALEPASPQAPFLMNLALNVLKQGHTDLAD